MAGRRDEAVIISKVYPHNAGRKAARAACERSLRRIGTDYIDVDTGIVLPTWQEALDRTETNQPAHVARFGKQLDMAGIIAPSEDADRAVHEVVRGDGERHDGTAA